MAYFAAALARTGSGWTGRELVLADVEDIDGVVDELRQVAEEAEVLLLFVEEDDEWFSVVRVDDDGDPRVFLSDRRVVETSTLGGLFGEAASVADLDDEDGDEDEEADEEETARAEAEPVGDSELLTDLGTPSGRLLGLCAEEGQLPADIISVLCERAGCLDVIESLREG